MHPSREIEPQVSAISSEQKPRGSAVLTEAVNRLLGSRGKKVLRFLICMALFSNARFFLDWTSGVVSYLFGAMILVTAILAIKEVGELLPSTLGVRLGFHRLTSLALAAGSVMLSFALIEAALHLSSWFRNPEDKGGRLAALAMPREWEKRVVQVEGSVYAYYWHGHLHAHNRDGMRAPGDFPPKRPGTLRIIALGDSLTYGYGIAERDTYSRVLERLLSETFRVEVLNLGVSGAQSTDILRILQRKLPVLQPGLVFYGVCLNDFLPSNTSEYESNRAYQVPVPYGDHFAAKTLTGKLLERQYDSLLMRWGLRTDFLTDILRDFEGRQERFARDVAAMNDFVQASGLPPMLAMVLEQYPNTKDKRYEVVRAAERHLAAGGIRVIPSDYIPRNDGRSDWYVSRWEGHPNEKAHRAFAEEIARALEGLPELQPFLRPHSKLARRGEIGSSSAARGRTDAGGLPSQAR